MKFLHIADLHLGKSLCEFSLIDDQEFILKKITDIAIEKNVDGILIAGDIYDRSIPNEDAVKLFDSFLTELSDKGKAVYAISGNHDSAERLNFGSRLLDARDIHIAGKYSGEIKRIKKEDAFGSISIWLLPFIKRSEVKYYFPHEEINTYEDAVRCAVSKCGIDTKERNVILAHQFVTGSDADPETAGSDNSAMNVGAVEKIGYRVFDDFDYAALGHIHSPQSVGRRECRYAGSILKYSVNEREINGRPKSAVLITLSEKGKTETECIELIPKRDIRQIRGNLSDLIKNAADTEDYISAILTDKERNILQPMAQLRAVYPNILCMRYAGTDTAEINTEHTEIKERTFRELVTDFYKFMRNREPDSEELEILEEAAREANVI